MASETLKNSLADKLRREDPEQFQTLVRMHLSFVLDLNTDDCDFSEKNKFRPSKWVFGKKTKCLVRGVMEGAPLTQEGICQAYQLIEFLTKESNICQEGIFRRTGKLTRQQELKSLLNKGVSLDLDNGSFSVHDCASVLKGFLAELPEPLLTDAHYPIYCQIAEFCGPSGSMDNTATNEIRLLHSLQLLLLLLPPENRILLRDVLNLLNLTASYESSNKMSAESLSTLFTPHLLCPRKLTPEAFHANSQAMSGIVAYMIRKGSLLFEIPPKLATDIRVYWAERERRSMSERKTQDTKLGLSLSQFDGNLCDGTAANTVFTFVDRERSAQENSSNPTEVALAQLYAHIQSLPESSKKRKLIKQFNKENGQGTPLQESYRQKNHHRSKSLGDSIKRHIFNKGVKRHKTSNHGNGFTPLRSLSQDVLNSPLSTAQNSKVFHCSLDEETSMKDALDPVDNLPALQRSLCDSNSAILRLRHSTRSSRSSFSNRLIFPENEKSDEANTSMRKAILDNLAHQVAKNHSPNQNGISRKLSFPNSQGADKCSSPYCKVSLNTEQSSSNVSDIDSKDGCKSGEEEVRVTPVSSGAVTSAGSERQSTDSANALLGFSPCLISATNKLTTPQKHYLSNDCLVTSTPAFTRISTNAVGLYDIRQTSLNHSNCFLTPIADENNSMSPITRSTQRMSKAMQETMMTPRSRKPVVVLSGSNICHLGSVASWRKQSANMQENRKDKILELTKNNSNHTSQSKTSLEECTLGEPSVSNSTDELMNNEVSDSNCCSSGDSLTSTFKSYLMSRSVLTASPVDLSFSSRTGDFDTSVSGERCLSTDALSDSLLYCLNGNDPQESQKLLNTSDKCHSDCSKGCENDRSLYKEEDGENEERCFSGEETHSDHLKLVSCLQTPVHETSL